MADSLVRAQSTLEFFKEEVEAACDRQRLHPHPFTSFYVVSLLNDFTHLGGTPVGDAMASTEPIAVRFARALQSGGSQQRRSLKQVGDLSLFLSGFFSDSLRRSLVDIDYYVSLGGYAYGSLGTSDDVMSPVFAELSDKFASFVDVLGDVSSRSALTNDTDLLRLYEKWLRTGSRRNGELLAEQGIVPNASIAAASRRVQ